MPLIPLMAAAGPTVFSGAVTLSATATLSTSGVRDTPGAVSLSAPTTLVSGGIRSTDGATTLAVVAGLTVNGIRTVTGAAVTLAGTATLAVGAQANFFAAASLSATSALSSAGTAVPSGGVNLSATSSLVAGTAGFFASVSLTVTGVLSVSAGAVLPGAISLAVVGNLSTNGIREVSGAVSLNAAATLLSTAIVTVFGAVTLATLGVLTADGIRTTNGAVSLAVTSILSTDGIRTTSGAVVLAAGGSLTGTGSLPSDSPPTLTAGRSRPVARGSTVLLDVIAAPPASQTISGHTWTIQSGGGSLTGAGTATPTYSPPVSGSGLAVIRDTVTASGGGSAFADVTVSYHDNVIAAENVFTGVARTTWDLQLPTTNLGGIATLQGFCDGFTADHTQTVNFKIAQSDTAGWTANIYRLGYYGGLGARDYGPLNPTGGQVTTSQAQPTSQDVDPDTTLKSSDCSNWSVTLSWTPPAWVPSGIYILKLNRTGGGTSHVMFIIRDDSRAADLMFMPADSTWNAYNAFRDMGSSNWVAGNSLYFGIAVDQYNADCARYVSYNRPFMNRIAVSGGYGAVQWSTFFTGEYGMLRFVERNGMDVKYYGCIDAAGDSSGTLLKGNGSSIGGVKSGIFTGHNEYWSDGMRAGWESFKAAGGSVFSCAGNEVFWRLTGSNNDSSGRPRTWECYKSTIGARGSTGRAQWTGTWRDPDGAGKGGNNPENSFTGTIFVVNGTDLRSFIVPFTGGYSAQPIWRNTTVAALASGSYTSPAEILGFEWDTYGPAGVNTTGASFLGTPHSRIRYCSTATHVVSSQIVLTDAGDQYSGGTVTHRLVVQPSGNNGGITFGTGTVNWGFGVDNTNTYHTNTGGDNVTLVIQQATVNILCDMGVPSRTLMAGLTQPTQIDWFPAGAATLTATPTLTAGASATAIQGAVSLAASASLTADGVRTTTGAVSLGVTSSLTASGTLGAVGATSLTAASVLSVSGVRSTDGSITLATVPVLTVAGVRTTSGNVSLTASAGLLTSVTLLTTFAGISLASSSTLAVNGLRTTAGAVALSSVGVLTSAGTITGAGSGSVTLSAIPVLAVAVSVGVLQGATALAALGTLSAGGIRVANVLVGGVPLVAIGGLNVNGVSGSDGTASLNALSTLLVAATTVRLGATQLTALSVLLVIPVGTTFATVTLVVTPSMTISGVLVRFGTVNLLATGGLTLAVGSAASATVTLLATGRLLFIDLFPQVSVFASGVWSSDGIHQQSEWSTAGIHTALAWSS